MQRVREVAKLLDLEPFLDRKPKNLSGGQRQRVAMGRAIVRRPQVYLMDEPLSNLDAKLRVQTRAELAELQARLAVTTVYVTHDQVEAMTMGHRVAVLRDGELQQCDTPSTLYHAPANLFVAGFIGSPAMNQLPVAAARPLRIAGAEVHVGERLEASRRPVRDRLPPRGAPCGRRPDHGSHPRSRGSRLGGLRPHPDRARARARDARRQDPRSVRRADRRQRVAGA